MSSSNEMASKNEPMEIDGSASQPTEHEEGDATQIGMPCELCVLSNVSQTEDLMRALKCFSIPFVFISDTNNCLEKESEGPLIIVSAEFSSDIVRLHQPPFRRVLGPTALIEMSGKLEDIKIPPNTRIRPLFCHSMYNLVICITGFRDKTEALKLVDLVKHMGGKIRREMNYHVTHLIANSVTGTKYKYADGFRVPVLTSDWVFSAWEKRFDVNFKANEDSFVKQYLLKPFQGTKINFFGFCEEEESRLRDFLISNGGLLSLSPDEALTTHVVVDASKVTCMPDVPCSSTFIVNVKWFYTSIHIGHCEEESKYLFGKNFRTPDRASKRKRIMDIVEEPYLSPRKSSKLKIGFDARFSSNSLLDYTTSPDVLSRDESDDILKPTPRHQVFKELCQTEVNYVNVLKIIIEHFKNPLEEKLNSDDYILNQAELKIIFGDIVPIFEVHCDLLKDLKVLEENFSSDSSIGAVFLKYCPSFKKVYPPFINFFQDANELLKEKEKNGRFYAFLKLSYMSLRELHVPEIDKQTLPDLLIRPVQRLGSVSLLLNDILKNTYKNSADHKNLNEALAGIRTVMSFLNENKQRQDSQRSLFDIYQDIENCPPQLINSHRSFVVKCDAFELSNALGHRGDCITLFLFTDVVEICKKRSKYVNVLRSPNTSKLSLSTYKTQPKNMDKTYKHLKLLSMTSIKKVYDIIADTEDTMKQIFALKCRESDERCETTYSFSVIDENIDKDNFLQELDKVASAVYCTGIGHVITQINISMASSYHIDVCESSTNSTLGRAIKYASKQVGRTFNLNRTPSTLRRVMSSMKVRVGDTV